MTSWIWSGSAFVLASDGWRGACIALRAALAPAALVVAGYGFGRGRRAEHGRERREPSFEVGRDPPGLCRPTLHRVLPLAAGPVPGGNYACAHAQVRADIPTHSSHETAQS